jgi:hypothetical protein
MSTWIKTVLSTSSRIFLITLTGILFAVPAMAELQPWSSLTPKQQEALAPIEKLWNSLPEKQQKRLLSTARYYHALSPEKKQRYLKNLAEWSKLSAEQRDHARKKYKAFKKIPPEKREQVKRMVLEQEAEKAREAEKAKENEIGYAPDYKDETPAEEDSKDSSE